MRISLVCWISEVMEVTAKAQESDVSVALGDLCGLFVLCIALRLKVLRVFKKEGRYINIFLGSA